jgi:hypothetical protein
MAAGGNDQTAMAFMEIAICIAQALHETDAGATQRMNFAAGKAYNRLKSRGDDAAAEILYRFGRALLDHELFPEPEAKPGAE